MTRHERAILLLACTAQFMVLLDVSIVNVALPSAAASLHIGGAAQAWVIDAYTVAVAGLLLVGGRLGDLIGVRSALIAGLALFTAASLAAGFAVNGGWLIAERAVQGAGGALVAPSTLTVLTLTFAEGGRRRTAFAVWSGLASTGTAAGGLIGGLLTTYLSWRWVMFVNVPAGLLALAAAWRLLPRTRTADMAGWRGLDLPGALTVSAGLALLAYGVLGATRAGWAAPGVIAPLTAACCLLAVFALVEARLADRPLVPLSLLRSPWIRGATTVQVLLGGAFFAVWYFVAQDLQDAWHYSALRAGLAFIPLTAAIIVATQLSTWILPRTGPRAALIGALLIAAAGFCWLSQVHVTGGYLAGMLAPSLVMALGLGGVLTPLTTAATTGVAPGQAGLASGVLNASRQAGGAIGLAVLATLASGAGVPGAGARYGRAFFASGCLCLLAAAAAAVMLPRGQGFRVVEAVPGPPPAAQLGSQREDT